MRRRDKTDTSSISFTAHYTGHVWFRNGLSAPAFNTRQGALYYGMLAPFETLGNALVGTNVRESLLQRHHLLDYLIEDAITQRGVTQVLEIACGLSPRGWRFTNRHPQLKYVEADLPAMAKNKEKLLRENGALGDPRHKVVTCNILVDGDDSLESVVTREFDNDKPLLIITEGLVNYFDLDTISGVWRRLNTVLRKFPAGTYLTDNYALLEGHPLGKTLKFFAGLLGSVSRSNANFHFSNDQEMEEHLRHCGFAQAVAHDPGDFHDRIDMPHTRARPLVRIIDARTDG